MFKWKFDNRFSFFILDNSGVYVDVIEWPQKQTEYLSQLSILNELRMYFKYSFDIIIFFFFFPFFKQEIQTLLPANCFYY